MNQTLPTTSLVNVTVATVAAAVENATKEVLNVTTPSPGPANSIDHDDATWVLTCTFFILTMQTGFGLLESGSVSRKSQVNIMYKNILDVVFGGFTYWLIGFGLAHGVDECSNFFSGCGYFVVNLRGQSDMGTTYTKFFFDMAFATTATTIVSGAIAERVKLDGYLIFSTINIVIYVIPAHWVWGANGWLYEMGALDIAGCGPVHLVGGVTALVACLIIGPRINYPLSPEEKGEFNLVNTMLGMFMLWWGWFGFNCGSTFAITGRIWELVAQAAAVTICGSIGGGIAGVLLSYVRKCYYDVPDLVNGVLAGLVSVTSICAVTDPFPGMVCGAIGAVIVQMSGVGIEKMGVDDPVSAIAVHAVGAVWGLLACGFFARADTIGGLTQLNGVFYGGDGYLLGIQALAALSITAWSLVASIILLYPLHKLVGLRLSAEDEMIGADIVEHRVRPRPSAAAPMEQTCWETMRTRHKAKKLEKTGETKAENGNHHVYSNEALEGESPEEKQLQPELAGEEKV